MAREHRKIEDEAEARRYLAAVDAAGVRIADWAREHGIDGRSLNAWRVNLSRRSGVVPVRRRAARGTSRPRLVELVPRPEASSSGRYVIWLGEVAVEVDDDFGEATLTRIANALRSC